MLTVSFHHRHLSMCPGEGGRPPCGIFQEEGLPGTGDEVHMRQPRWKRLWRLIAGSRGGTKRHPEDLRVTQTQP